MSFRLKIVLGLILIQVLLVIMLITSSLHFLRISNEVELTNRAFMLAPSLASLMRPAVVSHDTQELQREIDDILLRRGVVYVRVRAQDGSVIAQGGSADALARPFKEDFLFEDVTDDIFDVSAEIRSDKGPIGRVELGESTREVNEIMGAARRQMATIALSGLGVSVLISLMLGNYFARQLTRLRDATRRIAAGDIGYQLAVSGGDELAQTANAFNTMSRKLATLYAEKQTALNNARQQASELQESQRRIRAILDHAMDAIFTFDENGVIEVFNPAAERVFGISAAEAVGKHIGLLIPEPYLSEHETYIGEFLRSGDRRLFGVAREIDGRRSDGTVFPLEIDISEVRLEGRHLFIAIARDVTERRRSESQLREAQEAALESSRNKFEFIANISHEIRAPVSDMLSTLNVLDATQLTAEQRARLDDIKMSGDTLITIINDMLDFSRIEAGKLELESIDFDLWQVLDVVYQSFKDKAARKGINLAYVIPASVPEAFRGDPARLRQLLANLVDNAVKFTEKGEVTVRLEVAEETADRVLLRFEVEDTGIGIAPAVQQRIFEIFARAGAAPPSYGSSGLGLMISKRLAEMMNGRIGVHSEIGRGSTFWFTASLEKPSAGGARVMSRVSREGLINLKALIVNSDPSAAAALRTTLEEAGLRVRTAEDGMRALNELSLAASHGQPYDVAIIDMMVAGVSGIQLARAVRADTRLSGLRMVMLAATGYRGDCEEVREAGVHCYLTVPYTHDQLLDCIAAITSSKEVPPPFITRHTLAAARPERFAHALVVSAETGRQKHLLGRLERLGYRASLATSAEEALEAAALRHYDLVLVDNEVRELVGADQIRRLRDREPRADRRVPIVVIVSPGASRDEQQAYRTAGANACFTGLVDIDALSRQQLSG
jgi:two-component system sensor histidine kinase/response regulator